MRKGVSTLILVAFWVISVAACVGAVLFFYEAEYKKTVSYFKEQNEKMKGKLGDIKGRVEHFRTTVDNLNDEFRRQVDNLKAMKERLDLSEEDKEKVRKTMENLQKDFKEYSIIIDDLKAKMAEAGVNIDKKIDKFAEEVDLGEVKVEKK